MMGSFLKPFYFWLQRYFRKPSSLAIFKLFYHADGLRFPPRQPRSFGWALWAGLSGLEWINPGSLQGAQRSPRLVPAQAGAPRAGRAALPAKPHRSCVPGALWCPLWALRLLQTAPSAQSWAFGDFFLSGICFWKFCSKGLENSPAPRGSSSGDVLGTAAPNIF